MKNSQPNILAAFARVYVSDLDSAIPLYSDLTGEEAHRFEFRGLRLAKTGVFLLVEGAGDEVRSRAATITVRDIQLVAQTITNRGGQLLEGPEAGPNGPRLIARHPDGSVVEYIQFG